MSSQPPPPTRKVRTAFSERRRWRRRKPGQGVSCQLHSGGATAAAALLNLAEGGACVESPLALSAGDRLTLLLVNGVSLVSLAAGASVVWSVPCAGGYRSGLCFDSPEAAADLLPFLT